MELKTAIEILNKMSIFYDDSLYFNNEAILKNVKITRLQYSSGWFDGSGDYCDIEIHSLNSDHGKFLHFFSPGNYLYFLGQKEEKIPIHITNYSSEQQVAESTSIVINAFLNPKDFEEDIKVTEDELIYNRFEILDL